MPSIFTANVQAMTSFIQKTQVPQPALTNRRDKIRGARPAVAPRGLAHPEASWIVTSAAVKTLARTLRTDAGQGFNLRVKRGRKRLVFFI